MKIKTKMFWLGNFLFILCGINLTSNITEARAGGFDSLQDDFRIQEVGGSSNESLIQTHTSHYSGSYFGHSLHNRTSPESRLNWNKWTHPERQGDIVCRESNGNLICLSVESSQYMRW